jgi:transcription initiation factor TFIIIB Brf1 subunit/transcription initiation factor TFIIB
MDYFINKYRNKEEIKDNNMDLNCEHINVIYNNIDKNNICKNCGKIIKEGKISDNIDNATSENIIQLLPNMSMNCFISGSKYNSLQKIHLWTPVSSAERSLSEVFKIIDKYMFSIFNKNIIQESKKIYSDLYNNSGSEQKTLTRGNIRLGLIIASCYFALLNNGLPYEPFEMAKLFNINIKIIKDGIRKFYDINTSREEKIIDIKNVNHKDYFYRFCNIIDMKTIYIELCIKIFEILNLIKNNNTIVIIFGVIYCVIKYYKIDIKKSILLEVSNISEITLNKVYKSFSYYNDLLFIGLENI